MNMIGAFEKTPDPTIASKNMDTPSERLKSLVSKEMGDVIQDLVNFNVQ